ncbi:hypothetical protein CH063_04497 [Colletotrichum higginsianum]|uniref:Aminoglycoside phosphotransferase domain-containing protein n=2 Tax=Colletotrichum higginsianum TaxID=80884 RepID=H1UVN2_COLHI|nr:hypothetical protein CH63R_01911 [Colletotrichum higginsianum IMI 349063]OBR13185.1 hypothetical protein CH63R_01911 [Colletotrichum higginsianum IMI 349063]CCF32033.1 hypothetical protein CH063_04497 [Colletotrichum higginsianum]
MEPEIVKLATKIYITTPSTFTKKEYAPAERPTDIQGKPIVWKWASERLQNEGMALALIKDHTTIPVPRVIQCGPDSDGAMCLEVQYIDGIPCDVAGEKCRMPLDQAHTTGHCPECQKIASENTNIFIETEVIPQLRLLRSNKTGLNGVVIPPPRIEQFDCRDVWPPKKSSKGEEYVFCHGDLTRSNVLLDPNTLMVKSIIDWESAGFSPEELELSLWRLNYDEYMRTFEDTDKIKQEIELITA